jgi:hypothetical protein
MKPVGRERVKEVKFYRAFTDWVPSIVFIGPINGSGPPAYRIMSIYTMSSY